MAIKPRIIYGGRVVIPCETTSGWAQYPTQPAPTLDSTTFVEGAKSINMGAAAADSGDELSDAAPSPANAGTAAA